MPKDEDDFDPELVAIAEREFSPEDQEELLINEHERFQKSSEKVAHALVYTNDQGMFAKQFDPPSTEAFHETEIRPVTNIRLEKASFGSLSEEYLRAQTPGGTEMVGKRRVQVTTEDEAGLAQKYDLWRMSPVASHMWKGELWVGACADKLPIFSSKLSKSKREELEAELAASQVVVKEKAWDLDKEAVLDRERHKKDPRNPDQNTVMGHSAFEEMETYLEQYEDELDPDRKAILKKNKEAKADYRGGSVKSQHRGEWNHLMGHGLTLLDVDPQTSDNLAAAPKHINSQMMGVERVAKWVALHRPEATISGHTKFTLCPNSEILDYGHIAFTFKEGGQTVVLHSDLNPWRKYVTFPKPSDIAQNTLVASKLLLNKDADSIQPVASGKGVKAMPNKSSNNNSTSKPVSSVPPIPPMPVVAGNSTHAVKAAEIDKLKSSIVRVFTRGYNADYGKPWHPPTFLDWSGSGVIVKENGQLYILTNAHVVENHLDVRVRLANDDDEYPVEVIQVGYQCDMALMRVTDPAFLKKCKPLVIGDMLKVGQEVQVLGFPMGGEEMSYTTGPASRVNFDDYSESGEFNLQVQTQAPINPGNSGGPVLSDGKVVGLAFQSLELADGLNYVIPVPVMRHFIKDALSTTGYKGFPDIGMDLQELTNPAVRQFFGLPQDKVGVRVKKVDPLEDAAKYIQTDDVIIAVDGLRVSHDAKINVPGVGDRLDINYAWSRKFIGESVAITLLRKNQSTNALEKLTVKVKLQYRPGQTKKVGPLEFDKTATFYINSGVILQAISMNYLDSQEGLKFREIREDDDALVKDIACKNPGDQIIIINRILKCNETAGFHEICNEEVKSINGIEINNMSDVVKAMHSNKNSFHAIILKDKQLIVIPRMASEQHMALLKKYGITQACSEDLKNTSVKTSVVQKLAPAPGVTKKQPNLEPTVVFSDEDEDPGDSCHTDEQDDNSLASDDQDSELGDFIAPEDDQVTVDGEAEAELEGSDDELTRHADESFKRGAPGLMSFSNTLKAIEERVKAGTKKRRIVAAEESEEELDVSTAQVVAPLVVRLPHKKYKSTV